MNISEQNSIISSKGILLVVSGAAGTGKGTVNAELMKNYDGYCFSVSATTRAPRPLEVDGRDYHFISKDQFEQNIAEEKVIEYTRYCGNYYGTLKSELAKLDEGKNLILEIEVEGAMNIKRMFPEAVTVFILPPDLKTLRARLEGRGTNTKDDIENRLNKALEEFKLVENYDYALINPDGMARETASVIDEIVRCEKLRAFRNKTNIGKKFSE